ncbi:OmpA family protein [Flagellimonas sp. DF-77]|uniref:OmpA family protein n=1 Tax=Flagellimonas algarum TaxID=3230298 RepID=UPI003399F1AA
MRIPSYLIAFLFAFQIGNAQNNANAEKKYRDYHYVDAVKSYERLYRKGDDSQHTLERLGDLHFYNGDMRQAVNWYGQLYAKYERSLSMPYLFKYIHALQGIQNYELAKALMKIHKDRDGVSTLDVSHFADNDAAMDALLQQAPQFVVTSLSINSIFADFGPMFFQDKIVFASSRDSMNLHSRVYEWNKQPYLNLYEADTLGLGSDLAITRAFGNEVRTKYHEAAVAFNSEGTVMYLTRNNYSDAQLGRDDEGTNHLKLYRSELKGGIWTEPEELPFNDTAYSVGQPALSPDGNRLYFVSDMPGGAGQTDIYYVTLRSDGSYSEPVNLGPNINTGGREMFPYLTESTLYFASDGHLGLGGLDIFESTVNASFGNPENLGPVLNSARDDFGYIVNEATQRGYFSSNRLGGAGDDDIYSFERIARECQQSVVGSIRRKANDQAITDATVQLVSMEGTVLATTTSNAYGAFEIGLPLDCGSRYRIEVSKTGYESISKTFETGSETDEINQVPLIMTKALNELIVKENGVLKIKIDNIYFDLNKAEIRADAAQELNKIVEVMKEYPKMVIKIESHTDSRGSDRYNEKLSDRRAKSTGDYIISQGIEAQRIESAIGYGEQQLLNECRNGIRCTNEQHDRNRRSEFIIVSME